MCQAFMDGDAKESLRLQLEYKKLIDLLFIEVNPIPVKAALAEMGHIENNLRLPLTSMEKKNLDLLLDEMKNKNML